MKVKMTVTTVLVLVAILMLPLVLHAQETDPVSVMMAEMECINAGDIDCLMELYADGIVFTMVMGPDTTVLTGHEEVQPYAAGLMAENFRFEYDDMSVEGDTVTFTAQSWSDSINALGVAPLVATEVAVVQDGKVQSLTWTLSDESFAAFAAAMAAMATLPETGGGGFPFQAVVVVLGGLAVAGGLGLERVRRRVR